MQKFMRIILVLSIPFIHLVFSYYYFDGWWYSSIGTALILGMSYLAWKAKVWEIVGLNIKWRDVILALAITPLIILLSVLLTRQIGSQQGIVLEFTTVRSYYHDVFYILNEEMILGALALYLLTVTLRIKPLPASLLLALLFSLVHFIFYKWIFLDRGILTPLTLSTLFFVGVLRNNLILIFRHIGYSYALHFGWMVVLFGSALSYADNGKGLTELERFNTFLGSSEMLIITFILAIFSSLPYLKKHDHERAKNHPDR